MPNSDVFPTMHSCTKLSKNGQLFDVKFYPYPTVDGDQIFAVAGGKDVFICRPKLNEDPPFELLGWFKEEEHTASLNSIVWTKDPITKKPILCVAGDSPKQIKILEIETGRLLRSIPGHGKGINDLAISPLSTNILASCSDDNTIRLWNLHPKFKDQPCVAMFCGEGHRQPILAIHFHPNGKWMLSGGLDTAVCLWAVPSLEELDRTEEQLENHSEPKIIYYPHFYSTEVHHNYVDCVQFYGDLIISKASRDQNDRKRNEILLWKIDGFDPDEPPPDRPPIPSPDVHTRSSFQHFSRSRGFQRLLSFEMPHTDRFYHRFGLLHREEMRPILCMGNHESKYFFWDLQRLEEGWDPVEEKIRRKGGRKAKAGVGLESLNRLNDLKRAESVPSSDGASGVGPLPSSTSNSAPAERKYALSDPFTPLKPHATITPKTSLSSKRHFATSQMAWSPDGTWLVGVGDFGMMCIFHRDKSVINGMVKPGDAALRELGLGDMRLPEVRPTEAGPVEERPAEVRPAEARPAELRSVEMRAVEERPIEEMRVEVEDVEVEFIEERPVVARPVEEVPTKAPSGSPPSPRKIPIETFLN